jgi:hypothetical protein
VLHSEYNLVIKKIRGFFYASFSSFTSGGVESAYKAIVRAADPISKEPEGGIESGRVLDCSFLKHPLSSFRANDRRLGE